MQHDQRVTIDVTARYDLPPARIFAAWLDPETAGRWLFATATRPMAQVAIDARVPGTFCFVERRGRETHVYAGRYLEIAPSRRLVFTLALPAEPEVVTHVRVSLAPLGNGCRLALTHGGIPADAADRMAARWTGILYGLGETLATGFDDEADPVAAGTAVGVG